MSKTSDVVNVWVPQEDGSITMTKPVGRADETDHYEVKDHIARVSKELLSHFLAHIDGAKVADKDVRGRKEASKPDAVSSRMNHIGRTTRE